LSPVQVSILIPVYNEEDLVSAAIECVLTLPLWASVPVELIAVDDGSTDGSGEALDRIARERPCLRVVHHPRNRGKNSPSLCPPGSPRRVFARRPTASGQTV
jgi:glycosyltransferase involved in cell wall biosynthesis